jgi:glycerol-3-phosphate responsive antiterminator
MKKKNTEVSVKYEKSKIKRKGVVSKKKNSSLKSSKNYSKAYRGQGR